MMSSLVEILLVGNLIRILILLQKFFLDNLTVNLKLMRILGPVRRSICRINILINNFQTQILYPLNLFPEQLTSETKDLSKKN